MNGVPDDEGGVSGSGEIDLSPPKVDDGAQGRGSETIEGLVGDLLRALKTDKGRKDFKRLASEE